MNAQNFLRKTAEGNGVHLQLWLEDAEGEGFGNGRIELLALVGELGSLSKAAKKMGMSYRGAWGKIKKAEQLVGAPLLESLESRRDGCSLTNEGRELIRCFHLWHEDVRHFAQIRARELFTADEPLAEEAEAPRNVAE